MSDLETSELGYGRPASHDEFAAEEPEPASRGAREGLPKGYRMRAETHYVDMLPARRERFEPAPVSVPTPVPAAVPSQNGGSAAAPPVRSRRSDRVLAQVSEEIAAIASAAALLDVEASPLARQTGQELIRAQAWRASWLLKAAVLLDGRHVRQSRPVTLTSLVEQLRQGLTPECRLAGVTLQIHAPDLTVMADAPLVTTGVTGAVLATLALVAGCTGAVVRVFFDVAGGQLRGVEVAQDVVAPGPELTSRVFDQAWSDRPGGWTALMGALAAREAARLSGGTAAFTAESGGSRLRMTLVAG